MNTWIWIYIAVFCGGASLALFLTPVFGAIARNTGFLDVPASNHKKHNNATPLLGGAAMFTSWIIALGIGIAAVKWGGLSEMLPLQGIMPGMNNALPDLAVIAGCAALAVLLGLWDDKFAMSAAAKFGGQFVIALIVTLYGGVRLNIFVEGA